MKLGLFAQIGLLTHLSSLLVPGLGEGLTGMVLGGATVPSILGTVAGGLDDARLGRPPPCSLCQLQSAGDQIAAACPGRG